MSVSRKAGAKLQLFWQTTNFLAFFYCLKARINEKKRTFASDMNKLTRLFVWLSRFKYRLGFGIQSPNDYYFVRNVVLEKWPYYKYQELDKTVDDWLARKLGHLYFRLANWRQPNIIVDNELSPYWKAGCKRSIVTNEQQPADIIRIHLSTLTQQEISDIISNAKEKTILVIEDICKNKQLWQDIIQNLKATVTYDLYYCGLVMFDKQHSKKNYIINF